MCRSEHRIHFRAPPVVGDCRKAGVLQRVTRMQREIGSHGVAAVYRPPFANYIVRDFDMLTNFLPLYRQSTQDWVLRNQAAQYADPRRDALLRYSGSLNDWAVAARGDLRKPIAWFRQGVRTVIASPVSLLASLGVVSFRTASRITDSWLTRMTSGLIGIVTLVAAAVQIIVGWDYTIAFIVKHVLHP
jgi:hypothetical protein